MNDSFLAKIFLVAVFILSLGISLASEQPVFSDDILILALPDEVHHAAELSPNGQFAISRGERFIHEIVDGERLLRDVESTIYVWDLGDWQNEGVVERHPDYQLDLDLDDDSAVALNAGHIQIAPDSESFAINEEGDVLIYSLPDLRLLLTLPDFAGTLAWSLDSTNLLSLKDGQVRVYDMPNAILWEESLGAIQSGIVIPIDNGWLIDNLVGDDNIAFVHCTVRLDACDAYPLENSIGPLVLTPDRGQTVLASQQIGTAPNEITTSIWEWDASLQEYQQVETFPTNPPSCPVRFNSNGVYLWAACGNIIWDFPNRLANDVEVEADNPEWLGDSLIDIQGLSNPVLHLLDAEGRLQDSFALLDVPELQWAERYENEVTSTEAEIEYPPNLQAISEAKLILLDMDILAFVMRLE